ncbi:BamA/TamA family outer membrane protein [Psychrobacter sp. CAL346-MNA-CIBAN-0220]|uniref:autotransporter assembly complex protein TamA n=1 Tax=Psychrobacter sp. CAL346-MNA-CIBAN-0220 TaxID=3140457 RepID=UPI003327C6E1
MRRQPSTLPRNLSCQPRGSQPSKVETITKRDLCSDAYPRLHFTRSALFTALASTLVGFGMTPAIAADTRSDVSNPSSSQPLSQSQNQSINDTAIADNDDQLDAALDALHLKKAVEQGIIDQSVLEDYKEQNLGDKRNTLSSTKPVMDNNSGDSNLGDSNSDNPNRADNLDSMQLDDYLQQQATSVQQQGYQMMTPEQIDRELAATDAKNKADNNSDSDFNNPVATLDSQQLPIGLDPSLDAASLPAPTNLDTLRKPQNEQDRVETAEIMTRPIDVSDAVSSGRVDEGVTINQQATSAQMLAQQERNSVAGADSSPTDIKAQISADQLSNENGAEAQQQAERPSALNPNNYLPDYQAATDTQAVSESVQQASKPRARNSSNFVKRLYNRFFNGGYMALPHVETTVYLRQASATDDINGQPKLIKADEDIQPVNNIKAALDDTTVQSVADFTAALPRLRQTALDAAKAVGYYDITLSLRQPNSDTLDVIIEKLGEPVRVDSRTIDIRGAGIEQPEFKALEKELPPQEGDVFNHRVYKNTKAALESLSNTYGYFDQYWLNKSVDIILPDNIADVSLVYNTGERYDFDDVVFFTYDKESGTLTRDPEKLPVELSLLQQLFDFEAGDPFYRPAITKFTNDLSATRYFNTVNVESILPPDERSENSSLAFDNTLENADSNNAIIDDVNINDSGDNTGNNPRNSAEPIVATDSRTREASDADEDSQDNTDSSANNGESVNEADIAPIEFEVDEQTLDKLQAIKQKADRLSRLPTDRVLDEKTQETDSILGKISDSISKVAKKVFPDEEGLIADENFVPPTLEGRITPQQVQENKKVPLYVFVSADKPRDAQFGIGYGTDTGVRATGKIDYNLINRKGYQAGAEVALSRINKNATVYASRPWKHPLNDKLEARLTYEEETIDQGEGNFDLSTKTLKAALARNIRSENGWDRSYFVRYRLDELETGVDDAALDDLPVRFASSNPKQQALLLGYGVSKTSVDNIANPTQGYRQYYGIEAGADKALSDTDMAIIHAGVSGLYSFGEDDKHQVLGRFDTGYIWADDFYNVPYKLRFFAGGDQSLRGYDYNSLSPIDKGYLTGGQILAVGSAEYNYEFKPGFRGAIFTDIGNAYDKDFETETKVGVGVGIRWASPVGVVRVDVAAGVTEESIPIRLHFFIGSPL